MARFNEILAGRLNRALQKFTGIKGAASTPQLGTEVAAAIPLFWGAECRYLEGWNRFFAQKSYAGVAAQINAFRIRNPVGSGVVAVMEKITVSNDGAAGDGYTITLGPFTGDFASIFNTPGRFDARGNPQPVMSLSFTQAAGPTTPGNNVASINQGVNVSYDFIGTDIQEFPLLPGDAVQVQNTLVNNASLFTCWWRERPLEDSEKF